MNSYITNTQTTTYTVVDIRKTFEDFEADLRMIARRTGKWSTEYVDNIIYDIVRLAESRYLKQVDITLLNNVDVAVRAVRYTVNDAGNAITGGRAGGNDWPDQASTRLQVILRYTTAWHSLTAEQQRKFYVEKGFKIGWVTSHVDTSYSHLQQEQAQLYASKGYELSKQNFK